MAVSMIVQLLAASLMSSAAPDSSSASAAAPAEAPCGGSPVFDPKHDCKVIATGAAKLQCMVMADGSLQNCSVVSEDPPGQGFGQAALSTAQTAKVKADPSRPAQGVLIKGIPFNFKPED
jgi:TonB family protein